MMYEIIAELEGSHMLNKHTWKTIVEFSHVTDDLMEVYIDSNLENDGVEFKWIDNK